MIMENKKVKYFDMVFDENNPEDNDMGTYAIGIVDKPAILAQHMVFSETGIEMYQPKFVATDPSRRIITGAVMIPEMPIKRIDDEHGTVTGTPNEVFYVRASSDIVEKTAMRFMENGYTKSINLMHKPSLVPDGCFIFESFITDKQRGITEPVGYKNCPDKTWFVSMKINNDEVYNDFIKTGVLRGFSLEGNFRLKPNAPQPESTLSQLEKIMGNRNK